MRILLTILIVFSNYVSASDIDFKLQKVIEIYRLQGFDCKAVQESDPSLSSLGEMLFESTLLSGGNDTSCSTCHLKELDRVDGLSVSIGVGGSGEGIERIIEGNGIIVPRNSFNFLGRGHKDYSTYFWDGNVQNEKNRLVSIIGDDKSKGFHSPLSVAAVLPLLARDEFLGVLSESENNGMESINDMYYEMRYKAASKVLQQKILEKNGKGWDELRAKFIESKIDLNKFELSSIGNAIASFLIQKESCVKNKWSKYIQGEHDALTQVEKEGAYIFYGKGRCASCHSGDLLSDFKFHSIGVPQGDVGVSISGQDLGRAEISLKEEDRFKFKTPSLLKVSKTKPYGHNGVFEKLDDVVLFHLNPIPFFKDKKWSKKDYFNYGRVLSSGAEMLSYIDVLTEEDFNHLLSFLETL